MRIGELAARTGVSARSLRHYEARGLLAPSRSPNGYRSFDERAERDVRRIRSMLAAGLPTATIAEILPCIHGDGDELELCEEVGAMLTAALRRADNDIAARARERERGELAALLRGAAGSGS